jgi:ribosome-associated translation inhibitor RaiA
LEEKRMRIDTSFKHLEKSPFIEEVIQKDIKKVERRIKIFKTDEAVHLSFHIEKNPHRAEYFCWANLYLPFKVLRAQCKKNTETVAINDCFAALLKQLDKFKHKIERSLRRRPKQKRPQPGEDLSITDY